MEETMMNANEGKHTKIKTQEVRIVVDGTAEKPYYSIEWYDPTKNEYYSGYSSYCIGNVFKWLEECFEIVEAPKTNADRIRAMSDEELAEFIRDVSYECQNAYCGSHCQICSYPWCSSERTVEWLKQPAGEGS